MFSDDDFDLDNGDSKVRPNAPAEKHLRSPILESLLKRLHVVYGLVLEANRNNKWKTSSVAYIPRDFKLHLDVFFKKKELSYSNLHRICEPWMADLVMTTSVPEIVSPKLYPELLKRTIATRQDVMSSMEEATELYRHELGAFKQWATTDELQILAKQEENFTPSVTLETLLRYESYRYWDLVVERYRFCKKQKKFGTKTFSIQDVNFHFYDGFLMEVHGEAVIQTDTSGKKTKTAPKRFIYSYEQAQMLQDAALARFNAFLAIDAKMHNGTKRMAKLLKRLIKWQEDVLVKHGNLGYELVKGPESVAKAYLTKLTDGDVLPLSSFVRTVIKLQQKEHKLNKSKDHPLTNELAEIIEDTRNLQDASELFGCTKLSGHPFVYAEISAESVRQEACTLEKTDVLAIQRYHCHFKRLVLNQYLKKHKLWPRFIKNKEPPADSRLADLWKRKILRLPDSSYPLEDLQDVEFDKFMEFDYSPDYLDLIDDKAICPGAHLSSGFWFKQDPLSYRRLLESLIKKENVDTKAIVERMRHGLFTIDERIVELTQKEREFKTSARCFAKLTFDVRLFFIITEVNLKKFMGGDTGDNGYLPQQTMTMSNTTLRKRLYDLTSNKERPNTCLVEVDFSRWNLRWRACTVNPISRSLEYIFGLPGVFSQAHPFFSSSTIVLTDKHTLPKGVQNGMHASKWPESDVVWRNHRGGFEGIQQTLWSICTIAMMYYSLEEEQCSFQMAGQGDNQVFYVSFQLNNTSLSFSLQKFLLSMERRCERLNHEVKPEECVDSKTVLTYGKEIYAKGVHILYSLKFSSRSFIRLDHTIPSLTKEVSSLVSNALSTASTLNNTFRSWWWKFVQVLLLLRRRARSPIYFKERSGIMRLLKSQMSRSSLLLPGSVGGLPMIPWTRFFSKGETDDLSFDVAATYYLSRNIPLIRNYMDMLKNGEFTPKKIDCTNLINDPHSIPIEKPNDASHLVADKVSKSLPSLVYNKDIKQVISPDMRIGGEKYKEALTSLRPLHPQIAADLFELTPAGLYNKTVKRFTMTRTIEKIVPGVDMSEEILRASCLILSTLLDRIVMATRYTGSAHLPPYKMSQKLRDLWKIDLKNSSIGVYTPFDFQIGRYTNKKPTISVSIRPKSDILHTKGDSAPTLGSSTAEKVSQHGYKIVSTNSTMRDLKSAVLIFSELQGDNSVLPIVDSIIKGRSPWSLSQLIPVFPSQYGGSALHRHEASRHHFSALGSCSVSTHMTFSSDRAGILSGGEYDYPVVFQTLFLTLSNLYQNLASHNITLPNNLAYFIPDTLDIISDAPSVLTKPFPEISWPKLQYNKLAWVEDIFATEVPIVPDISVIPHLTSEPSVFDLMYSYLEVTLSVRSDGKGIWDGITSNTDFLDMKEASRVDPFVTERALTWVMITDVFSSYVSSDSPGIGESTLKKILNNKSLYYAGEWVRLRLHPSFADSKYNQLRNIALQPTAFGYKKPVKFLAAHLRRLSKEILVSNGSIGIPTLILFDDWKETVGRIAQRRQVLSHVIATYPNLNVHEFQETVRSSSPPIELLTRDPAVYLRTISNSRSRHLNNYNYILPEMPCQYLALSSKEAIRTLRTLPRFISPAIPLSNIVTYSNHGVTRYTFNKVYGNLKPVEDRSYKIPNADRERILLRRTVGGSSPLYSDWNAVLTHLLPTMSLRDSTFHLFGVGRGATGRALCERGMTCIGYDLLTTFPTLSHRGSSYIPPEIALSGTSKHFRWSDHTFLSDGNVMEDELDISSETKPISVVDLDVTLDTLIKLLSRLPLQSQVVVRYTGTPEDFRYLISVLRPDKCYTLCKVDSLPYDMILYVESLGPIGEGNFESVSFSVVNELSYKNSENEFVSQFMDILPSVSCRIEVETNDNVLVLANFLKRIDESPLRNVPSDEKMIADSISPYAPFERLGSRELRVRAVCTNIISTVSE
ncbi:MAG: RNA-dependent RNA polymerase [Sclerotinia sclerotiorum negative-stranded RNA virus 9]|uniref:RNA-directed RNA polymerase n=1 Tax=Sclerotinia sclerotiorum negative-stranded RNA virus 9 TaxID=2358186 RepID=A0AA45L0X8_9MONO|nr:MAG: RNA-dependent RNA polymerase [Sclerotinia sclerotiorum negative-stranded RNA virus 9]